MAYYASLATIATYAVDKILWPSLYVGEKGLRVPDSPASTEAGVWVQVRADHVLRPRCSAGQYSLRAPYTLSGTGLRAAYAMSGTDLVYLPMRFLRGVRY
eukprot:3247801-Rhodomonas_salina.1